MGRTDAVVPRRPVRPPASDMTIFPDGVPGDTPRPGRTGMAGFRMAVGVLPSASVPPSAAGFALWMTPAAAMMHNSKVVLCQGNGRWQ